MRWGLSTDLTRALLQFRTSLKKVYLGEEIILDFVHLLKERTKTCHNVLCTSWEIWECNFCFDSSVTKIRRKCWRRGLLKRPNCTCERKLNVHWRGNLRENNYLNKFTSYLGSDPSLLMIFISKTIKKWTPFLHFHPLLTSYT